MVCSVPGFSCLVWFVFLGDIFFLHSFCFYYFLGFEFVFYFFIIHFDRDSVYDSSNVILNFLGFYQGISNFVYVEKVSLPF